MYAPDNAGTHSHGSESLMLKTSSSLNVDSSRRMRPDEAASPTVMTESVLLTAAIEAHENRDAATWDIPNAFIQTSVDEIDKDGDRIIMKIRGAMVDILLDIDDDYKDYVVYEHGERRQAPLTMSSSAMATVDKGG